LWSVEVSGQHFSSEVIQRIQAVVDAEPSLSRRELSRRVCGWLDWRAPSGKLQEMSCRKALLELERLGVLSLPACTAEYAFQPPASTPPPLPELVAVEGSLADLGELAILPVPSRHSPKSQVWNALLGEFHELGAGPLCGAQIRYLVESSTSGWVGALSFSAGTWRLKARDEWIDWSEGARRAHLQQVICNSRFLILPTVRVPNLASHVLSQALARVPGDWQERYGYAPVLVETFVDGTRFAGTTYQAANWIHLGRTAARSSPYPDGKVSTGPKEIYAYPLRSDWQTILCRKPEIPLGVCPRPEAPADWVEEEFGRVVLYDERLQSRLYTLGRDFFARPGALIPQACEGSEAKTKAAYRFFSNPQVDMQTLLKPHVEATVDRLREHSVVLAAQDTSTLNYTAHSTDDMGPIHTKQNEATGLILHDTLAFSTEGVPLGLLDVQCWARDKDEAGKSAQRKDLPIEEKESVKWLKSYQAVAEAQALCPETTLVSVGDREADLYELFALAAEEPAGPELLVRAERSRRRRATAGGQQEQAAEKELLWETLDQEPVAGYQELHVPRKGPRPARVAKLRVRYAKVTLSPPQRKKLPKVELWAVYADEVEYGPEVTQPLVWMLLTTVPVCTYADACERLRWYALRWGIEVFHRTVKSGCRIEDRRFGGADGLRACLAIDLVVAWRIYLLTKQGRETPDIPCDVYLSEDEWQALYAYVKKEPPPAQPPTLREAVRMIAKLGGFLGRKRDGEPGTTTLWRGLQRLADITAGFVAYRAFYPPIRDGP